MDNTVALTTEFLKCKLNKNIPLKEKETDKDDENYSLAAAPSNIVRSLLNVDEEMSLQFRETIPQLCRDLNPDLQSIPTIIEKVANELFNEGIDWNKVAMLFVFSSEIAKFILVKVSREKEPQQRRKVVVVDTIARSVSSYVSSHLSRWIRDHGGWSGMADFFFYLSEKRLVFPKGTGFAYSRSMVMGTRTSRIESSCHLFTRLVPDQYSKVVEITELPQSEDDEEMMEID